MAVATLHDADNRAAVYRRLAQRNRLVAILRIGVPIWGILLLLILIGKIVVANIGEQYGVSGVVLERDALVIETPTYSGIMANGTEYSVTADKATAPLANTNILDLTNAILELKRPDGLTLHAEAQMAQYDLLAQTVQVPGEMRVRDSRQINAILHKSLVDWTAQTLTATGGADIAFADGTTLTSNTLKFDGKTTEWTFAKARLTTGAGNNDQAPQAPATEQNLENAQ